MPQLSDYSPYKVEPSPYTTYKYVAETTGAATVAEKMLAVSAAIRTACICHELAAGNPGIQASIRRVFGLAWNAGTGKLVGE